MLMPLLTSVHVIGVVIWIGGVAFVTMIIFPMLLRMENSIEKVVFFQGVEHRFARVAKAAVLLVGLTGGWLLHVTGESHALFTTAGIGPTVMLIVWVVYALILLFEGRLFKIIFAGTAQEDTAKVFARLSAFHWFVLALSLLAVGVGVWAAHGAV